VIFIFSPRKDSESESASERSGKGLYSLTTYPSPLTLFQLFQDLPVLRKAAFLILGKNQFPVSRDFESTAAGFDQLGFHPRFFLDGLCQTGSLGVVVSIIAVFDQNALDHGLSFPGIFPSCGKVILFP
jgi:hypothetical protein